MDAQYEMTRYDRVRHINVQVNKISFVKQHMHGSFELGYVLEGCVKYCRCEETKTLHPGALVLANPYESHSYIAQGEQPAVLLTVQIHKLFVRRYVDRVPRLKFNSDQIATLPRDQYDTLVKFLFHTAIAYFDYGVSQQFDILANAVLLLGRLVSFLEWDLEDNPDDAVKGLQRTRMQRLISYIDENYRQKITLSMLAEMEGISTTYLSHFFRKAFGVSFQTYLSTQRFEKALVLMHDKTLPMIDICMNCGFSDSRYLEAACQRILGCSVAEYRQQCEAQEDRNTETGGDVLCKLFGRKESLDILKKYLDSGHLKLFPEMREI